MHSPPVRRRISPCQLLVLLFSCCCSLLSHIAILALTLVNLEQITRWKKKKLILRPELKVPLFVFLGSPFGTRGFLFSDIWEAFQAFKYFTAQRPFVKADLILPLSRSRFLSWFFCHAHLPHLSAPPHPLSFTLSTLACLFVVPSASLPFSGRKRRREASLPPSPSLPAYLFLYFPWLYRYRK